MNVDNSIRELSRKHALLNALVHGGTADSGAVLGKVIAERPQLKADAKRILVAVSEVVAEVNRLGLASQRRLVEENWPEELTREKPTKKVSLPPLPNVESYEGIVTRFSPNPDSALHIGNARACILSHDYARRYSGKFILRFEDTDPRLKKARVDVYDLIKLDLEWLGCSWDEEFLQSDRLTIYYEWTRKLLEGGSAYVCTCSPAVFRELVRAGKGCPCRDLPAQHNLDRWEHMTRGDYEEGQAVVRIKTDLNHPNPAVREWPALRIIDTDKFPHPRVGSTYKVWPLYNLACGIDDHLMGVTHILRGKEHLTNMVRQQYLYHHLGWRFPEGIHYGRLKLEGVELSKSKMMQGIEAGLYEDFSDPRLPTLAAFRKRGIQPEAIRTIIWEVGPRPVDATLSTENLYSLNRKIIDSLANRYFFVSDPINLKIQGLTKDYKLTPALHPQDPKRGNREIKVEAKNGEAKLFVSKRDAELLKPSKLIRLMELFNIRIDNVNREITSSLHGETFEEAKKIDAPLIQWVPTLDSKHVEVVMPTGERVQGVAEKSLTDESVDRIVQFVRFGFCRIDEIGKDKVVAYYAHS